MDAGDDSSTPPKPFCQTTAAAGADFCDDFEDSNDVTAKWTAPQIAGGSSITRTDSGAGGSAHAALLKLSASSSGSQATLSKTINLGASKTQITIEYDALWTFPTAWSATTWNDFVTGVTRSGGTNQWYMDIERQNVGAPLAEWKLTESNGPTNGTPLSSAITAGVWHHIVHSYDGALSPTSGIVKFFVDGSLQATVSLTTGPGKAPASFDQLFLNAGAENDGSSATATELQLDNVIVRIK